MNTLGKVLVFLNFLFAIFVGVALIFDLAMRTQWKEAYYKQVEEAKILKASRESNEKFMVNFTNAYKNMQLENEKIRQDLYDRKQELDALDSMHKIKLAERDQKVVDADLQVQESLKVQKRLAQEIALLSKTVEERQTLVVKLEADVKGYRLQAQNYESIAAARQRQNENLLDQLRAFSREQALREAGVGADVGAVRNPNDPNPPAVLVNGKVERVDATDRTLVQLTVGTDHGVNKNHTLDIYRTRPEPKYLGMVRIVEAHQRTSVARLIPAGNAAFRPQLLVDDLVTSKITR